MLVLCFYASHSSYMWSISLSLDAIISNTYKQHSQVLGYAKSSLSALQTIGSAALQFLPTMRLPRSVLLPSLASLLALLPSLIQAASDDSKKPLDPCTITSPNNNYFYDLNDLSVPALVDGHAARKGGRNESWHARGYDYPYNFTLNFCAPVVENLTHVVGVEERLWRNVSAFYILDGETYSIG
jgi:hypothetical protein